jgi:hypothetical protein
VNVPVEVGPLCPGESIDDCLWFQGYVAYMGKTDLVNCAFVPDVPNSEVFREINNTCAAKSYFYGDSAPVDTIKGNARSDYNPYPEVGDVYCVSWDENCHMWIQIAGDSEYMYWKYAENCKFPFYGFDPEYSCYNR